MLYINFSIYYFIDTRNSLCFTISIFTNIYYFFFFFFRYISYRKNYFIYTVFFNYFSYIISSAYNIYIMNFFAYFTTIIIYYCHCFFI